MAIKLFWQGGARNEINFGDTISPMIVQLLSGKDVIYSDISRCDMAAIGSILGKVVKKKWKRVLAGRFDRIKIWGSGSFGPDTVANYNGGLEFFAVRGPLTRDSLKLPPEMPLGDPGLLIDRFDHNVSKTYRWGIIPHLVDRVIPVVRDMHNATPGAHVIDLGNPDVLDTIKQIAACDFIISSSLHGVIAADALAIPNVWMSLSNNVTGSDWKFADYFESVGRKVPKPYVFSGNTDLRSIESAATMADRHQVESCQKALEQAFKNIEY